MNSSHLPDQYKITVVITTFNRKALLHRAVTSVINQSCPAAQIIVVDDGSNDGTADMIVNEFPKIDYIYQSNSGISSARNSGIKRAKYPWIAFLDADDEWLPRKLEEQVLALKGNPTYFICHCDEIWIRRGRRVNPRNIHQKYGGHIFDKCLPLCVISPSAVLIHQSIFDQIGLFDTSMPVCEDYDMWLRICAREPVLFVVEKLLKKYGGHADQLSTKYWGMDRFRIYSIEKALNSGKLSETQRSAALDEVLEKIKIYISGAQKRNNDEELFKYQQKYAQYGALRNV
jgi:glycosyltransferase involved in cell wall biosynthesis